MAVLLSDRITDAVFALSWSLTGAVDGERVSDCFFRYFGTLLKPWGETICWKRLLNTFHARNLANFDVSGHNPASAYCGLSLYLFIIYNFLCPLMVLYWWICCQWCSTLKHLILYVFAKINFTFFMCPLVALHLPPHLFIGLHSRSRLILIEYFFAKTEIHFLRFHKKLIFQLFGLSVG